MDAKGCATILRGLISFHKRMELVQIMPLGEGKVCQQEGACPEQVKRDLYLEAIEFALAQVEKLCDEN